MSLYGGIYYFFFTVIYVQRCGHPCLTGLIYLCTAIYVKRCGHPSLTGLIYLFPGIRVQSCGLPCLTGSIYLCTGIRVQSCGLPCLTGVMCLFMMIFVQSSGYPSLNGTVRLQVRDRSKIVNLPAYVLVACLFLFSVTRICIRERFCPEKWTIYINTRQIPIVICSDLL